MKLVLFLVSLYSNLLKTNRPRDKLRKSLTDQILATRPILVYGVVW